MHRGAIADIDLDALSQNLHVVRTLSDSRSVIAVVKADAYGHGAVEVSGRLEAEGVSCLAVAYTEEALTLRRAGVHSPILVLFDKTDREHFFEYNLIPVIHDPDSARRFSEEAKRRNRPLDVHVKVDTGMGRLGLNSENILDDIIAIAKMDNLNITGLMSHFADSDSSGSSGAGEQLRKFVALRESLLPHLKGEILCHISNSAAVLSFPDAHLDAVRPGLMLYGYSPSDERIHQSTNLKPVMQIRTRILTIRSFRRGTPVSYGGTFITKRESHIAVLPVGYADGYGRVMSNNADVLIRGKRAPVVGRVCMDLMMTDVTEIEDVKEDDEVVLLGTQGAEEITAHEIAAKAGTISYEVLTSLGNRSKRVFRGKVKEI